MPWSIAAFAHYPNAKRPPPHWLRNDADDIWRQHVGIDGVIGGGTGSW